MAKKSYHIAFISTIMQSERSETPVIAHTTDTALTAQSSGMTQLIAEGRLYSSPNAAFTQR